MRLGALYWTLKKEFPDLTIREYYEALKECEDKGLVEIVKELKREKQEGKGTEEDFRQEDLSKN